MAKFQMNVTVGLTNVDTARVGDGSAGANPLAEADVGKLTKMVGDSQHGLCAVGDEIEGVLSSVEPYTADGYAIGGVQRDGRLVVTLDGFQATPGTGTIVFGDFVVAGTPVARGTPLNGVPPKVLKATAAKEAVVFQWRVLSILSGNGSPGSTAVIERL